jgi:hypothetical protein
MQETLLFLLLGFALFVFGAGLPMLEKHENFGRFISFRWISVCFVSVIMTWVIVIDGHRWEPETEIAVIKGGMLILGIFIGSRSVEKIIRNAVDTLTFRKGDMSVEVTAKGKTKEQK